MPRKKKITNNKESTDDQVSPDSQNSQIEFNTKDLDETSGQELANILKRAVKYIANIYTTAERVVENDLLNKVIYLSASGSDNIVYIYFYLFDHRMLKSHWFCACQYS